MLALAIEVVRGGRVAIERSRRTTPQCGRKYAWSPGGCRERDPGCTRDLTGLHSSTRGSCTSYPRAMDRVIAGQVSSDRASWVE